MERAQSVASSTNCKTTYDWALLPEDAIFSQITLVIDLDLAARYVLAWISQNSPELVHSIDGHLNQALRSMLILS